jgi:hypothetical protein
MTAGRGIRGRRSDAGVVRTTQRDLQVLRWLGEMYGAPMATLSELYGTGDRVTRRHAARLEQAGYASRTLVPGSGAGRADVWLIPTRKGLRFAGLEHYERQDIVGWKATHTAAVGRLRLALEVPGATWESERAIRHRWHGSGARVRIADGGLTLPGGHVVGVELELHRKTLKRYPAIVDDVDPTWDQVWWFVPGDPARHLVEVTWLRGVLESIPKPQRPEHLVYPLTGDLGGVFR